MRGVGRLVAVMLAMSACTPLSMTPPETGSAGAGGDTTGEAGSGGPGAAGTTGGEMAGTSGGGTGGATGGSTGGGGARGGSTGAGGRGGAGGVAGASAGRGGGGGVAGASAGRGGGGSGGGGRGGGGGSGTGGTSSDPSPIAFWRFNEGGGTTVADSTGFGQTLTLSANNRWTTMGHEGASFAFDGANDVAGVVPQVGQPLHDYPMFVVTFSAWVRPDQARPFATAVARTHEDYAFQDFWLGLVDNKPACSIHSPQQETALAPTPVPMTAWTHIACTHDLAGDIRLYVNGTMRAMYYSGAGLGPIQTAILVGASEMGNPSMISQYFPGAIDDVRIYNVVLTDAQVAAIAQQ
jgi:hypothetical protein